MNEIKRIAKGFFWNQVGRSLEYVLIFLLSIIIAKFLGSQLNGIYASILSLVFFFSAISSLGIETAVNSTFPKYFGAEISRAASAIRKLLLFRILSTILIGGILYIFQIYISKALNISDYVIEYFLYVICFYALKNIISLLNSFLISFFKTKAGYTIAVAIRIFEVVSVYFLIIYGYGLREIFILLVVSNLLQLIALFTYLHKSIWHKNAQEVEIKDIIFLGIKFWLNSMLEFLFGKQAVILILGIFSIGFYDIGNLDVSFSFAQAINIGLTIGLYGVSVAAFSTIEEKGKKVLSEYWITINRFILIILIPAFIFFIIFAKSIVLTVYSEQYLKSVLWFQIFAFVFIVTRVFGGGVAADYLQSRQMVRALLVSSLICGVVTVALTPILIYYFGIYGAVGALVISNLLIALLHFHFVRKVFDAKIDVSFTIKILLISVISAFAVVQFNSILNYSNIPVSIVTYLMFALVVFRIIKPLNFRDIEIINKINPRIANIAKKFASVCIPLTDRQKWAFNWLEESEIVLDIGCSNTPLINYLSAKSKIVIGIDSDLQALRSINKGKFYLISASAENLPIDSEVVDTVLMLDVLEHLDNDKMALAEAWRVLKKDGVLILSVPYKGLFKFLDPENLSRKIKNKKNTKYHKHYSYRDLRRLLFRLFKIEKLHYGGLFLYPITFGINNFMKRHFGIDLSNFWKKIGDIDNDISWGRLSYNVILKARKI